MGDDERCALWIEQDGGRTLITSGWFSELENSIDN